MGSQRPWERAIDTNLLSLPPHQIGTGVFSTPATIFKSVGSVGLALIYWVIGALIGWAGLAYYLEVRGLDLSPSVSHIC